MAPPVRTQPSFNYFAELTVRVLKCCDSSLPGAPEYSQPQIMELFYICRGLVAWESSSALLRL